MRARTVELLLLLVCLGGVVCLAEYTRTISYEGEVLIKCSGLKREVIQSLLEGDGVDVWHVGAGGTIDFRISSEEFQKMKDDLPECREERSVEELVREMETKMHKESLNKTRQDDWFEAYHGYDEIVNWYQELALKYEDLVKFVPSIGKSIEGRDMPAIHITAATQPVKKFYFQCQIHAREWISGATCMYIAHYMVNNLDNGRVVKLLDETELIIVPLVNPDGYAYTWSDDRLWRKNRRINEGSVCIGVDLNRNYPDHWNEGGSSGNPCSETYHGTGPASEPETQNTINCFKQLTDKDAPVVGAIDWHSYGQLILRPYGWTDKDAPDEDQLRELGAEMSAAIFNISGSRYTNQKSIGLYPTTGSADDWFYSDDANEGNGEFRSGSYTIELRDTGFYGFILPPSQIIPTGNEIIPAVLVLMEELKNNPLKKKP